MITISFYSLSLGFPISLSCSTFNLPRNPLPAFGSRLKSTHLLCLFFFLFSREKVCMSRGVVLYLGERPENSCSILRCSTHVCFLRGFARLSPECTGKPFLEESGMVRERPSPFCPSPFSLSSFSLRILRKRRLPPGVTSVFFSYFHFIYGR